MRFVISSNPVVLAAALQDKPSATVEAEYGNAVVEGSVLTMAHHGPRAGQPAPCAYENGCADGVEVVGLSHFDLDTLGGCAAILGRKVEAPTFWQLAEFIDLNGAHKLNEGIEKTGATPDDVAKLFAFWAWSRNFRVFPNRDGSVSDVTDKVIEGCNVLDKIMNGDADLMKAGTVYKDAEGKLNADSFVEAKDGVVVRVSSQFTNHLYNTPDGKAHAAVVAYTTTTGAVTVSFADSPKGKNARQIVQELWGELAGGHAGIAGSPRDRRMSLIDLTAAVEALRAALAGK
ncbi:MAG: hypothetical protein WC702_02850 [Patescibacteria group bacterium]|jgi:hypothetical protein